jgi:hypothetical protein
LGAFFAPNEVEGPAFAFLIFERARLQSCRKAIKNARALAPEGRFIRTKRYLRDDFYTESLGFLKTRVDRSEKKDSRFVSVTSASPG